jgi:DNA primase
MADQAIQQIRDRLDIVDVLGGYIQVKRAGTNFKASCPFHHEKSPSLVISQPKQIWHCFGCGEGGDIFGFVMRYEKLEFKEALKLLAQKAGVELAAYKQNPQAHAEKELAIRINMFAAKFYHQILKTPSGKEAAEYLAKRKLTPSTITEWQIGYSPNDFGALRDALIAKKVSVDSLVKAWVAGKNERGNIYDRFRDRITFPIQNFAGDIVGFSARQLHDSEQGGKYINSPETIIYHKSEVLFGLFQAKSAIRDADAVVV